MYVLWLIYDSIFILAFVSITMSNTEPTPTVLEPQAFASVDQLASALAQNVNISSATDEKTPPLAASGSKLADEATSQSDSQVKNLILVPDTKKPSTNTNFHLIKWIEFNYERLPILLQNINGPCPLLAIFNILLLRKRVKARLLLMFHASHVMLSSP